VAWLRQTQIYAPRGTKHSSGRSCFYTPDRILCQELKTVRCAIITVAAGRADHHPTIRHDYRIRRAVSHSYYRTQTQNNCAYKHLYLLHGFSPLVDLDSFIPIQPFHPVGSIMTCPHNYMTLRAFNESCLSLFHNRLGSAERTRFKPCYLNYFSSHYFSTVGEFAFEFKNSFLVAIRRASRLLQRRA